MRVIRDFALLLLLFGFAHSRSVQLDLVSLVKNAVTNRNGNINGGYITLNERAEKIGDNHAETIESGETSKISFILFGNLEDLDKYRIDTNKNENHIENKEEKDENSLQDKGQKEGNPKFSDEGTNFQVEGDKADKPKVGENDIFKIQDDFDEDDDLDDSEDYRSVEEQEGQHKRVKGIFSDYEYDDYVDRDNAAEEEVSSEEEGEDDRMYDEDEKYYKEENSNEDETIFDEIFKADRKK